MAGRVGKARQVPLWSSLQNCCCTLRESTTRPPRTDPHARTHSRPKAASSGRAAHELLNPRVLTAFLCQAGTSGSDLALTKPPSRRRRAEPSLLDLSRKAGQKASALCPQLNRRKFQFACNSPLKRSTLLCRSPTTCGSLQVSDPSTPLPATLASSPATPIHHRQPPSCCYGAVLYSFLGTALQLSKKTAINNKSDVGILRQCVCVVDYNTFSIPQ